MILQERKAKLEQAELDKWKEQFTVDASGEDALTIDHVQQLRQDICERIKQDKVCQHMLLLSTPEVGGHAAASL